MSCLCELRQQGREDTNADIYVYNNDQKISNMENRTKQTITEGETQRKHKGLYTRVIGLTRHTSKQSRGNKAKLQTNRLQHKSTKNTNRRYITCHVSWPSNRKTQSLYFNTLFITKSYIAEVYTVQRTVYHTSLYLQNTLLYIRAKRQTTSTTTSIK